MSIAPMVLDQDQPTADVKDAFAQFAPDGFATIVDDMHHTGGHLPAPQVWKGMPVMELINETCNSGEKPEEIAELSEDLDYVIEAAPYVGYGTPDDKRRPQGRRQAGSSPAKAPGSESSSPGRRQATDEAGRAVDQEQGGVDGTPRRG